jgi:hypothetical protein
MSLVKISTGVTYKTSSRNGLRENQYRSYLQNIQQEWISWKSVKELLTKHPAGMSFVKISTGVNYKTSSRNKFRENQYRSYLQNIQQEWVSRKSVQELITKHPAGMSFVKIGLVTVTLYSRHQLHLHPHCPHFLTPKCQIRLRRSICNFVKPFWILGKSVRWNQTLL